MHLEINGSVPIPDLLFQALQYQFYHCLPEVFLSLQSLWVIVFIRVDNLKNRESCASHRASVSALLKNAADNLNYWKMHIIALLLLLEQAHYCKSKEDHNKILKFCLQTVSGFLLNISLANNSRISNYRCRRISNGT